MSSKASNEAILEMADEIDDRWIGVRTAAGVIHIRDSRAQARAESLTPGWRPRAVCGVGQADRGGKSGGDKRSELIPVDMPVSAGITRGEGRWCRTCTNGVRREISAGGRKVTYETRAMAGSSSKRVIITGPINRNKLRGASYPGFRAVADHFRGTFVRVIDPSDVLGMFTAKEPYSSHVRSHMELFWEADALVAMEGWEGSNVATLLVVAARAIRMPILEVSRNGEVTASEHGRWQEWCAPLLSGPKERMLW